MDAVLRYRTACECDDEMLMTIAFCRGSKVGCVAQWLERRSLTGELSLASARSVADV